MPELPEVETIVNGLRVGSESHPAVVGSRIESCEILWEKTIQVPVVENFCDQILHQEFQMLSRRGKFALFHLSKGVLIVHLRMSGDLVLRLSDQEKKKHDRLVLGLNNGYDFIFTDARKFGRVWLVDDVLQVTGSLGPEPFDPFLTDEKFYIMLRSKSRQIKPLLMDQTFLAGLGNIYTDESLFTAGIHPKTRSNEISPAKSAQLLESIRSCLQEGILNHGASIDWVYRGGDFQEKFQVYRRTGLPCVRCGKPIKRMMLGQRGTHYCPDCQV